MKTFLARWPNGDVSLVAAESKEQACRHLDEVGDPFDINLIPLENKPLAVHFRLTDLGDLELEELTGAASDGLSRALPRIHAVRGELYDTNIKKNSDHWRERMQKAVENERVREYGCNAEDASWKGLGYDQLHINYQADK